MLEKIWICDFDRCYEKEIKHTSYILDMVITENDLYYLSSDYSDWLNYAELKKELEEKEQLLSQKLIQ
jgi:hypothetical protein